MPSASKLNSAQRKLIPGSHPTEVHPIPLILQTKFSTPGQFKGTLLKMNLWIFPFILYPTMAASFLSLPLAQQ
jgi:hypothetical protein